MGAVAYKVYYGIGKNSELNWETFYGGRVGGGRGEGNIDPVSSAALEKKEAIFSSKRSHSTIRSSNGPI